MIVVTARPTSRSATESSAQLMLEVGEIPAHDRKVERGQDRLLRLALEQVLEDGRDEALDAASVRVGHESDRIGSTDRDRVGRAARPVPDSDGAPPALANELASSVDPGHRPSA